MKDRFCREYHCFITSQIGRCTVAYGKYAGFVLTVMRGRRRRWQAFWHNKSQRYLSVVKEGRGVGEGRQSICLRWDAAAIDPTLTAWPPSFIYQRAYLANTSIRVSRGAFKGEPCFRILNSKNEKEIFRLFHRFRKLKIFHFWCPARPWPRRYILSLPWKRPRAAAAKGRAIVLRGLRRRLSVDTCSQYDTACLTNTLVNLHRRYILPHIYIMHYMQVRSGFWSTCTRTWATYRWPRYACSLLNSVRRLIRRPRLPLWVLAKQQLFWRNIMGIRIFFFS